MDLLVASIVGFIAIFITKLAIGRIDHVDDVNSFLSQVYRFVKVSASALALYFGVDYVRSGGSKYESYGFILTAFVGDVGLYLLMGLFWLIVQVIRSFFKE